MPKTIEDEMLLAAKEGRDYFGCLIDGKAFTPSASFRQSNVSGGYKMNTGMVYISAWQRFPKINVDRSFNIEGVVAGTGTIDLPPNTISFIDNIGCPSSGTLFNEYQNTNGRMRIVSFDTVTNVIAGEFEFDMYSQPCNDTIRITRGRFGIRF